MTTRCAITLSSKDAHLVLYRASDEGVEVIDAPTKKIPLVDHEDADALRAFRGAMEAAIKALSIQEIALEKCTTRGRYTAGAASLKMEAIIQLLDTPVRLIEGREVNKTIKKYDGAIPESLEKYQHDAFFTALTAR